MRFKIAAALALIVIAASRPAQGGACTCNAQTLIVSPGFSVYTTLRPTLGFVLSCNGNASYDMTLSTGSSGTFAMRTMTNGSGTPVNYNVYTDATRASVWGGTTGVQVFSNSKGPTPYNGNLYLEIPAVSQDASFAGPPYQDVITATLTPSVGYGGTTNTCQFTLQSSVIPECQAPGATLSFPPYDPVAANATAASPLDSQTTLFYKCTKDVNAVIQLDLGSSKTGARFMLGPIASATLGYQLYSNSARTAIWGDTIGVNTVSAVSSSKDTPLGGIGGLKLYGRIPGGQDALAGSYSDSVTATINY